jgi:hypothetical protein
MVYEWETTHICTQRFDKILYCDDAGELSLSIDGGVSILRTLDVSAVLNYVVFAHIFENGNIIFGFGDKMYLSTDNLLTYSVVPVKDIDGNDINPVSIYNKARMHIRATWLKPGDDTAATTARATLTTENSRISLSTTSININMPSNETQALSFREGVYQLELVNDIVYPHLVDTLLEGQVIVKSEVTL